MATNTRKAVVSQPQNEPRALCFHSVAVRLLISAIFPRHSCHFIRTPCLFPRGREAVIALNSRFPRLTPDSKVEPSAQLPNTKAFMLLTPRKHQTSFYLVVEGCARFCSKSHYPSTGGRRMRGRTGKEGTLEQETKGTRSKRREEDGRKAGGRREETKRAAER